METTELRTEGSSAAGPRDALEAPATAPGEPSRPRGQYWAGLPVVDERRLSMAELSPHRATVDAAIHRARVRLALLLGALVVGVGGAALAGVWMDDPTESGPVVVALAMLVPGLGLIIAVSFLVLAVLGESRKVRLVSRLIVASWVVLALAHALALEGLVGPLGMFSAIASLFLGPTLAIVSVRDDRRGLRVLDAVLTDLARGVVLVVSELHERAPDEAPEPKSTDAPTRTFLVLPGAGIALDRDGELPWSERPRCAVVTVEIPATSVESPRADEREVSGDGQHVYVERALTPGEREDLARAFATGLTARQGFVIVAGAAVVIAQAVRAYRALEGALRVVVVGGILALLVGAAVRHVQNARMRRAVLRDLARGAAIDVRDRDGLVLGAFLPESGAVLSEYGLPSDFRTVRPLDPPGA